MSPRLNTIHGKETRRTDFGDNHDKNNLSRDNNLIINL